jgi:predicted dehydrogenase
LSARLRWGILGTGWIAAEFARDLDLHGFDLTAVGSRTLSAAEAFASTHGIPTAHESYQALVNDPSVDVVYISTPHSLHRENSLLALNAGKHVLVEKAFALNANEARQILDAAASRGLVALEAMWMRWLPHMVRIREIIAEGSIGEVRTIIGGHDQSLPTDPAHRLNDPELGGGALLDLGIYPISLASDILGTPTSINAISSPVWATGVDRQTAVLLGYAGGQQSLLHAALDQSGPNTASLIGTEGRIDIDGPAWGPASFTVYDATGTETLRFDTPVSGRGMQFEAWELERLVAAGPHAESALPPDETISIMETLDAIRSQIGLTYPSER